MKLTTAQSAELHIVVSGLVSLLASAGDAAYQLGIAQSLSVGQIIATFFISLAAMSGASFLSIVHAATTSPQATQAVKDTALQGEDLLRNLFTNYVQPHLIAMEQRLAQAQKPAQTVLPVTPMQTPLQVTSQDVPLVSAVPTPQAQP